MSPPPPPAPNHDGQNHTNQPPAPPPFVEGPHVRPPRVAAPSLPPSRAPPARTGAAAAAAAPQVPKCGKDSVYISVNATLGQINKPVGALYLALYASNDWKTWWQANTIDMVEEQACTTPPSTPTRASPPIPPPLLRRQFVAGRGGNTGQHNKASLPIVTYGCIGTPGYVYLMGCVMEGYPHSTHLWSNDDSPPFEKCIALQARPPVRAM